MKNAKATISLDADVHRQAKAAAALGGISFSKFVEQASREEIVRRNNANSYRPPMTSKLSGGVCPRIDINKTCEVIAFLDSCES